MMEQLMKFIFTNISVLLANATILFIIFQQHDRRNKNHIIMAASLIADMDEQKYCRGIISAAVSIPYM